MGFVRSAPTSHAPKQPPAPDSGPEGSLRDRRGGIGTGEGTGERTGEGKAGWKEIPSPEGSLGWKEIPSPEGSPGPARNRL